jgi:3,4-dihydroxy 2-butanone 4-phosphate synthase/GTP cyclohydrolase II
MIETNRPLDTIESALEDLLQGKMIIVVDNEDRENEGDFVFLADFATPELINTMATLGRGMICAPLTQELASTLHLPLQTLDNSTPLQTAFTITIDAKEGISTGISAADRAHTLKLLTTSRSPADFSRPGHIFPLIAKAGGVLERQGHTEAAVDLARICGVTPVGVICEIMNPDGTMARRPELNVLARQYGFKMISIEDLREWRLQTEDLIDSWESVTLPTQWGEFQLIHFASSWLKEEHVALVKGLSLNHSEPILTTPVVRLHSECLTGDLFGSLRCDCGEQLQESLMALSKSPQGILIYLKQEGRGIGLKNKIKAYQLQESGLDTVEANLHLGFPADARSYALAAQFLRRFQLSQFELLTNNPQKLQALKKYLPSTTITRTKVFGKRYPENIDYLKTKEFRFGHWLQSSTSSLPIH